jgi:hypothetical protein
MSQSLPKSATLGATGTMGHPGHSGQLKQSTKAANASALGPEASIEGSWASGEWKDVTSPTACSRLGLAPGQDISLDLGLQEQWWGQQRELQGQQQETSFEGTTNPFDDGNCESHKESHYTLDMGDRDDDIIDVASL